MTSSLDRKLERVARQLEKEAAERARLAGPREGLTKPVEKPELPFGVWESTSGVYKARCRSCGSEYELVYDPSEFSEEGNYCGGSPRCLP